MYNRSRSGYSAPHSVLTIVAAASLLVLALPGHALAYTLKTLHSFCSEANCGDGEQPVAGLLRDPSGNLYGTTPNGGKEGVGLVFKLVPDPVTGKYREFILHNFCARANCADGSSPEARLIIDADGNLYGTTQTGGKFNDAGVIFKLTHGGNGWSLTVLHNFCSANLGAQCADGRNSISGLTYAGVASGKPWDESSPLFGTALGGGQHGGGVAFKLLINGGLWQESIVHDFDTAHLPLDLTMDAAGNLFGVTAGGGKFGSGILYRLAAGTWNEATLHNFCAEPNCADGFGPVGRLAVDAADNLFGATSAGGSGAGCTEGGGCGVAFEYTAGHKYKVIYDFCSSLSNCKDGVFPLAGMILNAGGDLFGTTNGGGKGPGGTVFMLSHGVGWTEKVLHNFCTQPNCADGETLLAPVILDSSGNLYGATSVGGANGEGGTVFELKP